MDIIAVVKEKGNWMLSSDNENEKKSVAIVR